MDQKWNPVIEYMYMGCKMDSGHHKNSMTTIKVCFAALEDHNTSLSFIKQHKGVTNIY